MAFVRAALISVVVLASACAASSDSAEDYSGGSPGAPTPGETGGICGGIAGFQCNSDADYCAMAVGVCVNIADASGICEPTPQMCTREYRPVCGCDGKTYGNACDAASNGVNIAAQGACESK